MMTHSLVFASRKVTRLMEEKLVDFRRPLRSNNNLFLIRIRFIYTYMKSGWRIG